MQVLDETLHQHARTFWRGRTVALTGATGFLGHHVAMLLRRFGADVTALVRQPAKGERLAAAGVRCLLAPLENVEEMTRACRGAEFLFHLAGAVDFAGDWNLCHRINVEGTRNVLEAVRRAQVRRLVHTSSIVTVGASRRPVLLDETAEWNLGSLRVPYLTTKRQGELAALKAAGPELDVVVVNPACVVGPDDFHRSEFGTLVRRFWRGRVLFYFGGGNNFVDVRDVAWGHLLAAMRGRSGERYLLTGVNRSFTRFFTDLTEVTGRTYFRVRLPNVVAPVVAECQRWLPAARDRRPYLSECQARLLSWYFYFDGKKARNELGYQPRPWRQTLADTWEFWKPDECRKASA